MRGDSKSSQLSSAPSVHFLNRYSTSSIAEDKAEVLCYPALPREGTAWKSTMTVL